MAGTPLKRLRREQREADQLATYETVKRPALPEPRPIHEPATYSDDLIPELLALAEEGYASVEIAAHWAISEEVMAEWVKAHPQFKEALNHARAREKAWWVSRARLALKDNNNKFPAGAWSHVMRAKFPEYDDKSGMTVNINTGQQLVIVHRTEPEPLHERVSGAGSALIEHEAVRLSHSPTGSPTAEGSAGGSLSTGGGQAVTSPTEQPPRPQDPPPPGKPGT